MKHSTDLILLIISYLHNIVKFYTFLIFLFLNETIEAASMITKYIAQIVIENSMLIPLNIGVPPNKYWLKSQLGVTKYFTQSHL